MKGDEQLTLVLNDMRVVDMPTANEDPQSVEDQAIVSGSRFFGFAFETSTYRPSDNRRPCSFDVASG